jgi:hypothetical protein
VRLRESVQMRWSTAGQRGLRFMCSGDLPEFDNKDGPNVLRRLPYKGLRRPTPEAAVLYRYNKACQPVLLATQRLQHHHCRQWMYSPCIAYGIKRPRKPRILHASPRILPRARTLRPRLAVHQLAPAAGTSVSIGSGSGIHAGRTNARFDTASFAAAEVRRPNSVRGSALRNC